MPSMNMRKHPFGFSTRFSLEKKIAKICVCVMFLDNDPSRDLRIEEQRFIENQ
jgi:hypothetical protein